MSSPSFIEFGRPPFPRSDTLSQSGPLNRFTSFCIGKLHSNLCTYLLAQQTAISRFNKMKLTNANFSILRILDELGENHDADIVQAKQQISNQNRDLKISRHASHTHCSTEYRDEIQSAFSEKCELKRQLTLALLSLLTTWTFTWIERT